MAKNKMPGITIEGDSELGELLKSLPGNLLREAESGMREVGKIVVKAAQSRLVPGHGYDSGLLKKSIGIKWIKKLPRENKVVMYVGPRKGFEGVVRRNVVDNQGNVTEQNVKHNPVKIAHLVEFGHQIVTEEKGKASKLNYKARPDALKLEKQGYIHENSVPARPFLRPAIDENRSRFNAIMVQRIRRLLELRAARAAKKAAA